MLKFENTEVLGWEHAIRGMRNPLESWARSDSLVNIGQHGFYDVDTLNKIRTGYNINGEEVVACADWINDVGIGPNDQDLMTRLRNAGTDHRKFMRMLVVYVDITGPLYWWKEFDTYKVGTVANSCSTMHKIHAKEFTLEDFSCEHLFNDKSTGHLASHYMQSLKDTIDCLNCAREKYLKTKYKTYWWQMIQLLPSSYNQRRTVMLNYEVLANIYKSRKGHRLDEWKTMIDWIESLPYSNLITGKEE